MDVDLSTDLNALLPLVAPLLSGHSDLAIGTRLARGSRVIRGPREWAGRRRAGSLVRRGNRHIPVVPRRVRRADQLAAARGADLAGRLGLGVAPRGADRPDPGRGAAVGRLGAGDRPGVQLHERHHAPLLHGRAGARHRRPGGYRGDGLVAAAVRSGALAGRIAAAAGVLASAVWAYILLDRTPDWLPWLRWVVLVAGVAAAGLVLAGPALARLMRSRGGGWRWRQRHSAWPWWPGWPGQRVRAGHGGHRSYRRDPERRAGLGRLWRRPGRRSRRPGRLPRCRAGRPRHGRDRSVRRVFRGGAAWAGCRAEPVPAGCRGAVPADSAPGTGRAAAAWEGTPR